jgi:hypothetical protein
VAAADKGRGMNRARVRARDADGMRAGEACLKGEVDVEAAQGGAERAERDGQAHDRVARDIDAREVGEARDAGRQLRDPVALRRELRE